MDPASRHQVTSLLGAASQLLSDAGCDTPRLDAEVLLAHVLGQERAWLYAHPDYALPLLQLDTYQFLASRRAEREPIAYLTGHKEFFGLDFLITPDVLIPRPETEHLVELALQWAATPSRRWTIADIGTGSGAIAVSLAVHLPGATVIATDVSPGALAVAHRNAIRHGVGERVQCVQCDLVTPLRGPLHLIVANPPYLTQAELAEAPPEVARWEPRAALDGGPDGLTSIRAVLAIAASRLHPQGTLLVEIGAGQGCQALELARQYFLHAQVEIFKDYANHDRILAARYAQ